MATRQQIEVVACLERLLKEALAGNVSGISYSRVTPWGVEAGWAGDYSGRRLVVVDKTRRVVAIDDPHAETARRFGAER